MSSMTFGQKTFTPTPPDKGSFPLDHDGICRKLMINYMKCLNINNNDNSACRKEAREYLGCRMDNNLMAKEEWKKLGLELENWFEEMVNILIGCTGSVATIKLPILANNLLALKTLEIKVRIIVTEHARHFYKEEEIPADAEIFCDADEWLAWGKRGDPVLHIELSKWADVFVIAPLDANTLGKIANGLCDNLLTCTARAWELHKPLLFCPAMNTKMYQHPLTDIQINTLKSWGYQEVPVIEKTLICGDVGPGAMAEVHTIVKEIQSLIEKETYLGNSSS